MRNGFFGSLIILVGVAGLVWSDEPRLPAPAATLGTPVLLDAQATPICETGLSPFCVPKSCCFGHGGSSVWGSAEYLLWWIKGGNVPPLVTTGTPASGGVLGAPGTSTLVGGGQDFPLRSGGRFTLGAGLDCNCTLGVELGYFFLNGGANGFGASSSGAPGSQVLSRPFFNVISGLPDVQVVAFPGFAGGSVRTSSTSNLQGADLNLFTNVCCLPACCATDCCTSGCSSGTSFRLDVFAGPRWLQLNENVVIAERLTDNTGTIFAVTDHFETRNNFYGGQIGARAEWQRGRWFVNVLGKVALGDTHEEVLINGTTTITVPGAAPITQRGGLLALPTNIGTYSRDAFTVVPEINFNVGYQLTNNVRVFAGYTFLYWSNVARPGDQIDLGVNPTQLVSAAGPGVLVGPARPAFTFHESSFWAQGINIGLEFRW